jgi:hypothetical protein
MAEAENHQKGDPEHDGCVGNAVGHMKWPMCARAGHGVRRHLRAVPTRRRPPRSTHAAARFSVLTRRVSSAGFDNWFDLKFTLPIYPLQSTLCRLGSFGYSN